MDLVYWKEFILKENFITTVKGGPLLFCYMFYYISNSTTHVKHNTYWTLGTAWYIFNT